MPREIKGVVVGRESVFLENHVTGSVCTVNQCIGDLVWVSYDYISNRVVTIRKRNK